MCASQCMYILKICVRASFLVYGVGARFGPVCAKVKIEVYMCSSPILVYIYTVNMCACLLSSVRCRGSVWPCECVRT